MSRPTRPARPSTLPEPRALHSFRRVLRNSVRAALLVPTIVLGLAACAADAPPPVLRVGDIAFSELDLGGLSVAQTERLADLAAFGSIVADGELAHLGEPWIARERQALLLQRLAAEVSVREAGLDEELLRARYAEAPDYELDVRHLVILAERWRSDEERAEARRKAQAALERIQAGEDFAAVAGEVSEEPGADRRGGLLRPGREGTWVPEFWEAASALDVGQVSDVVETEYGYHVLKLEDRRPVPFEEVRERVLGRLVDLAAAAGRAEAWADREARQVQVDVEAVAAWRRGEAGDTLPLAAWPDGAYRTADLRDYLLTLEPEASARLESTTDAAYAQVVASVARNAFLAERAGAMGLGLSADELALVERKWVEKAQGWAATLGFTPGMTTGEVKAAALKALAATQQSARIVRDEVVKLSPVLRRLRPVSRPATERTESPASGTREG